MTALLHAEAGHFGQGRLIAVHGVDRLDGNEYMTAAQGDPPFQVVEVVAAKRRGLGEGRADTVANRGVYQLVVQDGVGALGDGRKDPEVGVIAGVEEETRFCLVKASARPFQRFAELGVSADEARSGGTKERIRTASVLLLDGAPQLGRARKTEGGGGGEEGEE